jgi:mRNA interferase RelE/StbE
MKSGGGSAWQLILHRNAEKGLRKLPRDLAGKLLDAAEALRNDPFPPGVERIKGSKDVYRTWFGVYRIVYAVDVDQRRILVTRIAHRKEVYRNLP